VSRLSTRRRRVKRRRGYARRNPTGPMTDTEKVVLGLAGLAAFVAIVAYASKASAAPVQLSQGSQGSSPSSGTTPATMPPMAGVADQVPPFVPGFS